MSGNKVNIKNTGKKNSKEKKKSAVGAVLKALLILFLTGIISLISLNLYITLSVKSRIIEDKEELSKLTEDIDCIMVLGASVVNGEPSHMLADRLDKAIELYKSGIAGKLLMSGDNGSNDYNEIAAMRKYAEDKGVAPEDIYEDHAGFSTYESMYRASEIFGIEGMIIVTQEYHLYRALYIARQFGIDVYGAAPAHKEYVGDIQREIREILARTKDFIYCIFRPKPTYMGEKISISESGS